MAEKIFEVERTPGEELVLRFRPYRLRILPEATRGHVRAAQKEFLLALRSLLDAAIEYVERPEKRETRSRKKIQVE